MKLTAEQEAIRTAPSVSLTTIEAGAGTGKTFLLTKRAQYLVSQNISSRALLFLTFTRQAREELNERLNKLGLYCEVKTLHGFALQNWPGQPALLNNDDSNWKKILTDLRNRHHFQGQTIEQALEQAWQQGEFTDPARLKLRQEAEAALMGLAQAGKEFMTPTSLLAATVRRWSQSSEELSSLRGQYRHVFVDEAQDLSPLQVEFVRHVSEGRCLTVVGDPQQSIFSFQHSEPGVFAGFVKQASLSFPLTVNFRSPGQHLLAAEKLTGKMLVPASGFGGTVEVRWSDSASALIEELIQGVKRFLSVSPGETVTVLVRSNAEIQEVTDWLRDDSLSVSMTSEERGTLDTYCRDVLRPVTRLLTQRKKPEGNHPLLSLPQFQGLSTEVRQLFTMAWKTRRRVSQVREVTTGSMASEFLNLWEQLEDWHGTPLELLRLLDQTSPSNQARHYAQKSAEVTDLHHFLEPYASPEEKRILVRTIHSAKGLEWRNVILFEGDDRYGKLFISPQDHAFLEEVRLRYVAVTRSTENLLALLHRDCHPAYELAFGDETVQIVRRTEEVLLGHTEPEESFTDQLWSQEWFSSYIEHYATPAEVQRVTGTEAATEKSKLRARENPVVQRIPLTGWKKSGRT